MKRTPLKRNKPISRIPSDKQKDEKARRRLLKWELFNDQERKCAKCKRFLWWDDNHPEAVNYPHLSHKKSLGRLGKTTKENCEILCAKCHSNKEHNLRNIYNEQPMWNK